MARLKGTDRDDVIEGTAGGDIILGLGGDDELIGLGGKDRLSGGDGSDIIVGGDGSDRIDGGADDDYLKGENGNDRVEGGTGEDVLYGGDGADLLSGNDGDDLLYGEAGDDVMAGGAGADVLLGGLGLDRYDGGDGDDLVSFFDRTARNGVSIDLRVGQVTNDGFGNAETVASVEGVTGTLFADVLLGSDVANTFYSGASAGDTIRGFGGDDMVSIGSVAGATLDGGTGSDTLFLAGALSHIEAGRLVTVKATAGMVVDLAAGKVRNDGFGATAGIVGFEDVTTQDGDDTIKGDAAANHLYGGGGDDYLSGGAGRDTLSGGWGADTLKGGGGADVFGFGIEGEFGFGGSPSNPYTDTILDFSKGDKLDIVPNGFPLRFLGTDDFDGRGLAIRYEVQGGDTLIFVQGYLEGEGAEFSIKLVGVHHLTEDDFLHLYTPPTSGLAHEGLPLSPASHLIDMGMIAIV